MKYLILALTLFSFSSASMAEEPTTAYKIYTQEQDKLFEYQATKISEHCGAKVATSIDWASFQKSNYENFSASSVCAAPAEALYVMCRDQAQYKDAVAKKVKAIKCSYGTERKIELTGDGTINFTTDTKTSGDSSYATDYYKTKL